VEAIDFLQVNFAAHSTGFKWSPMLNLQTNTVVKNTDNDSRQLIVEFLMRYLTMTLEYNEDVYFDRDEQNVDGYVYHYDYKVGPVKGSTSQHMNDGEDSKKQKAARSTKQQTIFDNVMKAAQDKVDKHLDYYGGLIIVGSVFSGAMSTFLHLPFTRDTATSLHLSTYHETYQHDEFPRRCHSAWVLATRTKDSPLYNTDEKLLFDFNQMERLPPLQEHYHESRPQLIHLAYAYMPMSPSADERSTYIHMLPLEYNKETLFPVGGGPFTRLVSYLVPFVRTMDEAIDVAFTILEDETKTTLFFDVDVNKYAHSTNEKPDSTLQQISSPDPYTRSEDVAEELDGYSTKKDHFLLRVLLQLVFKYNTTRLESHNYELKDVASIRLAVKQITKCVLRLLQEKVIKIQNQISYLQFNFSRDFLEAQNYSHLVICFTSTAR